jgi:hypothetical protein
MATVSTLNVSLRSYAVNDDDDNNNNNNIVVIIIVASVRVVVLSV